MLDIINALDISVRFCYFNIVSDSWIVRDFPEIPPSSTVLSTGASRMPHVADAEIEELNMT